LFHKARDWSFGPAPFDINGMESVLTRRGYKDVEELASILLEMDLVFRQWYSDKEKVRNA
jgi:hypothetical protein